MWRRIESVLVRAHKTEILDLKVEQGKVKQIDKVFRKEFCFLMLRFHPKNSDSCGD